MENINKFYTELTIGEDIYKCVLRTQDIISCEDELGKSLMDVILGMVGGNITGEVKANEIHFLPTKTMAIILKNSLQKFQHGITMNKTYELIDKFKEEQPVTNLLQIILNIFQVSGIMNTGTTETEKN